MNLSVFFRATKLQKNTASKLLPKPIHSIQLILKKFTNSKKYNHKKCTRTHKAFVELNWTIAIAWWWWRKWIEKKKHQMEEELKKNRWYYGSFVLPFVTIEYNKHMNSIQFPRAVHAIQMHTHTFKPQHKILRSFSHSHRTTALCSVCTWPLYTVHTLVYTSVRNQGQKSHVINCDVKSSKHTVSRPAHSTISIHAQMILWSYTSHIHFILFSIFFCVLTELSETKANNLIFKLRQITKSHYNWFYQSDESTINHSISMNLNEFIEKFIEKFHEKNSSYHLSIENFIEIVQKTPTFFCFSSNKNAQFWWHFAYPYLDLS